ncbi:ubp1-associated protein 2a [Phtheirospermum japonicum]|uniref:Ubp1-associated protein 2a n=1 Tax=Phtheirospermum japonicum TaxID=374723 RepID=A0A830CS69_9LAMI|nr:ubp1-associated protein 2a [Phtheirospermum japonicum]
MAKTNRKRKLVKKFAATATPTPLPPIIEKKITKKKNNKIKKNKLPKPESPVSDSDSDPQTQIQTLLEPFSKEQLVTLVTDLSLSHSSLFALIQSAADQDISHRKIFIHGLGWDATHHVVESIFGSYGEIEDLNVVNDRATGKCKGYAFLTFKTRKSAKILLKNPKVEVGNRITSCQLASEGPAAPIPAGTAGVRKIYVNNVQANVSAERLKAFFEQFGEIESGPKGFDPMTGRFKGYAIFVYRTAEAAKKVLEEPYKVFDGSQLHCQKAVEGKGKLAGGAASITTALQPVQPQMLAAVAAAQQQAQSMALFGPQAGIVNPLYGGGMIVNPNLGAMMGGYYGMMGGQVPGLGLGAYSVTGSGDGGAMLQGLQYLYPGGPTGQNSSSSLNKAPGNNGYSPMWYYNVFVFHSCAFRVKYIFYMHCLIVYLISILYSSLIEFIG